MDEQTKKLQELYNQQQAQQLAAAQAERDKNLGSLDQQLNSGLPSFVTQRNQADYSYATDAQKSKEMMAAIGANASGDNVNMQGRLFTNRQNNFNQINGDENKFRTDIGGKKNDVNSNYMLNETNIKTTIAQELARQLQTIQEAERQRQIQIQEAEKQRQWEAAETEKQRQWQASQNNSSSSSSSNNGNSSAVDTTSYQNNINNDFYNAMLQGPGQAGLWLNQNRGAIIDAVGEDYWKQLSQVQWQAAQEKNKRDERDRNNKNQKW